MILWNRVTVIYYVILGDRLMTDVVFANQNRMMSVLVSPLSNLRDHPVAIIFRFLLYTLSFTLFNDYFRLLELQLVIPFVYFLMSVKKLFRPINVSEQEKNKGDNNDNNKKFR